MSSELTLLTDGLIFPESPRWKDDRLWITNEGIVTTVELDGNVEIIVPRTHIAGIGFNPDGDLLMSTFREKKLLCWDGSEVGEVADVSGTGIVCLNDMVVHANGNSYIAGMMFDPFQAADKTWLRESPEEMKARNADRFLAPLVLVRPNGESLRVAEDLNLPNGAVISEDGKTLIWGESIGCRYTAFDIADDGTLHNRRIWADLPDEMPDGCTLDAEGAIWVSSPEHQRVVRVLEGGRVDRTIELGGFDSFACMLGGPSGTTLFLCCSETYDRRIMRDNPSGKIYTIEVDVPHAGRP